MSFFNVVYNRFDFFKEMLVTKFTNKNRPLVVTFSMNAKCNFKCKYCYGDYENRKYKEITKEEVLQLINELSLMGTRYLQLSGGEPLLFQGIEEVVNLANNRNICLGINTNGSLIKHKLEVVEKIKTIAVSLDGDEQSNDANRGVGTFKQTIEGIEIAQSVGVRVHIYTTVTKNNVNSLDWIMEFCKAKGIYAEFGFLVNRSLKNDQAYQGIDLDINTFKAAQSKLVDYKKKGYPILFSLQVLEKVREWPDFTKKRWEKTIPRFSYIPCYQGKLMVFIDCDGKVYPCIQMIGEFDALDFREFGFKKAYENCMNHKCKACYLMCVNDFNLLFRLNPGVIWNNTAITFKEFLHHKSYSSLPQRRGT